MGLDGVLLRFEGLLLLAAFVGTIGYALRHGRRENAELQADIAGFARTGTDLRLNLLRFALAAVLLYFGAQLVVLNAPVLGANLGLSMLLTGLIPVAIGTALPEVAAAVFAARRGEGDLVVGHVIGSSVFNLLVVVGGMAAWNALPLPGLLVRYALPAALAFALLLYPVLRGDLAVSRREGALLLLAFAGWIALELLVAQG